MNVNMYVMTHKEFKCPNIEGYIPLQVGAYNKKDLGYQKDSTGENISIKNPNYCELTGKYWIWKNDKISDIIGISHYRRFFTNYKISRKEKGFINREQIKSILQEYDIILPKKEIYKETAYEQYCLESGFKKDLDKIRNIISVMYPDYIDSFDRIMKNNKMYQFNMMITDKKNYASYCEWLFNILFELEKDINLDDGYNDYQKRIYGFISERLLNVWVEKNNLKVKQMRVINLNMNWKEIIRLNLRRIKNEYIFNKNKDKRR